MINVALIGAGAHSMGNHVPALAHYAAQRPGRVHLSAVCDLEGERARAAQAQAGFARAVTGIGELFAPGAAPLDALIVVLPIPAMRRELPPLFARGLPLLIEKPLGASLEEAEALWRAAASADMTDRVMVSLNRRHDPGLACAQAWLRGQPPVRYIRAAMYRSARHEASFCWGTGVHVLDALQHLAGPLTLRAVLCPGGQAPDAARVALLQGRDGIDAVFEMLPTAGEWDESFRLVGDGYQVDVHTGALPPWRVRAVRDLTLALETAAPADEPTCVANGTCAETAAFLDAVVDGRPLPPATLADALASSRLAAAVEAGLGERR